VWVNEVKNAYTTLRLCSTAGIHLAHIRITCTTSRLVGTYPIRKIVVIGAQLIGTIRAHPCTTRALGNREGYTGRSDNPRVVGSVYLMGKEEGKNGEEQWTKHDSMEKGIHSFKPVRMHYLRISLLNCYMDHE
jgi:hypothetical protein